LGLPKAFPLAMASDVKEWRLSPTF